MGNSLGGKKTTKIIKIDGETIKLKTPVQAGEVTKDYPGFVLLESESVKHFGIRAKPLGPHQELKPKCLYFLVELPKLPDHKTPRKVRSSINMGAKDRLDSLMLARRSVSDLSLLKPKSNIIVDQEEPKEVGSLVRLRMRVPKAEVERLMKESVTEAEAAEKIMQLCLANNNINTDTNNSNNYSNLGAPNNSKGLELQRSAMVHPQVHWKEGGHGGIKPRQKRVGFLPVHEGEIQLAVA